MIKDNIPVSQGVIVRLTVWYRQHQIKAAVIIIALIVITSFLYILYSKTEPFRKGYFTEGIPASTSGIN